QPSLPPRPHRPAIMPPETEKLGKASGAGKELAVVGGTAEKAAKGPVGKELVAVGTTAEKVAKGPVGKELAEVGSAASKVAHSPVAKNLLKVGEAAMLVTPGLGEAELGA